MKYVASKMINKSRFNDLVKTLNAQQYEKTIGNINRLISENSEYVEDKNYGHLCNLFTSLALVWMYEEEGKSKQESEKIVLDAMYQYLKPQVVSMQKLASHKWFVPMLKVLMPIKFKHTLGYGWKVTFPKTKSNNFSMITHSCIYAQIFSKYGYPEMTKGFCKVDNIMYDHLPNTTFSYSERIGEGGKMCDYSYERIDK